MASHPKAYGSVVQTFRYSKDLLIRLEYNPQSQMQRVYFNNEQRSAVPASLGEFRRHQFGGYDTVSEARAVQGSRWDVLFLVTNTGALIRYALLWQARQPDDQKWVFVDGNMSIGEVNAWRSMDSYEPKCPKCGRSTLACLNCDEITCGSCDTVLTCPRCADSEQEDPDEEEEEADEEADQQADGDGELQFERLEDGEDDDGDPPDHKGGYYTDEEGDEYFYIGDDGDDE